MGRVHFVREGGGGVGDRPVAQRLLPLCLRNLCGSRRRARRAARFRARLGAILRRGRGGLLRRGAVRSVALPWRSGVRQSLFVKSLGEGWEFVKSLGEGREFVKSLGEGREGLGLKEQQRLARRAWRTEGVSVQ